MRPQTKQRKIGEEIAENLREAIVEGQIRPGEALPSERELAQTLEVNRSSVREAILRLEAWGLVEIRQGGSTRVRDYLVSAGLGLLPHLFSVGKRIDPGLLRDLHEIRAMLFGWCAERAAVHADAAAVQRLETIAQSLSSSSVRTLQELDYDFFDELVRITGNRVLSLLSNVVRDIYMKERERFAAMYRPGVFDPSHHRRTVEAIRLHDPATASAEMRAHALSALATLEEP